MSVEVLNDEFIVFDLRSGYNEPKDTRKTRDS